MSDRKSSAVDEFTGAAALAAPVRRAPYLSPQLQSFGAMSSLTMAGAGSVFENDTADGRQNMGGCANNNMMATNVNQAFCS